MLYFLDYEYQRHPEEWDFDQLKARFAEALTTCSTVKNSPGLRWTVVRGLHPSASDCIDHYTIRGLDTKNLSVGTVHLYANQPARGWMNRGKNGGRFYHGDKSELS